jgi:hypothetical protein
MTPLLILWATAGLFLVALLMQRAVPFDQLVLDANRIAGVPWYIGLLSNLGIVGWSVAAAAAGGGAWVSVLGHRHGAERMLRGGAVLSILFLLDDLFQIHMLADPVIGVPKSAIMAGYATLTLWWLGANVREIARTRTGVFAAALLALMLSVVTDRLGTAGGRLGPLTSLALEDGLKFLGILAWAQYYLLTAADIVRSVVAVVADPSQPTARVVGNPSPSRLLLSGRRAT